MSFGGKLQRAAANPGPYIFKAIRKLTGKNYLPFAVREFAGKWLTKKSGTSKFRSVYVVTYGRSGSTLITGYLSRLPGFDIRGENLLFPMHGYFAEKAVLESRKKPYGGRESQGHPWYGTQLFHAGRFRRDFTRAVLNQLYPNVPIPRTVGFKEIRYWRMVKKVDFAPLLDWLRSLREPGAVVFMFRDLDKVLTSAWWAKMEPAEAEKARKKLENFEEWCREYQSSNPEHAFIVTYEEFTTTLEMPKSLCDFLGVEFQESVWRETLNTKYSWKTERGDKLEEEM